MRRYEVIRVIGRGSFGQAILCTHRKSGTRVVVKQIDVSGMDDAARKSSRREAQILSSLAHPAIIQHFESFEEEGTLSIVTEFAARGDLGKRLADRRGSPFPEHQILQWLVELCSALLYLHRRKILHRDLKLQNVFLASDDSVRLGDFGIARVLKHTFENARSVVGTPYYLSPEICESKPYNHKSDIWALGCILYELCAHRHAFEGDNITSLIRRILRGTIAPLPDEYSEELRGLITLMLSRSPSSRPPTGAILQLPFLRPYVENFVLRARRRAMPLPDSALPEELLHLLHPRPRDPSPLPADDRRAEGGGARSTSGASVLADASTRDPARAVEGGPSRASRTTAGEEKDSRASDTDGSDLPHPAAPRTAAPRTATPALRSAPPARAAGALLLARPTSGPIRVPPCTASRGADGSGIGEPATRGLAADPAPPVSTAHSRGSSPVPAPFRPTEASPERARGGTVLVPPGIAHGVPSRRANPDEVTGSGSSAAAGANPGSGAAVAATGLPPRRRLVAWDAFPDAAPSAVIAEPPARARAPTPPVDAAVPAASLDPMPVSAGAQVRASPRFVAPVLLDPNFVAPMVSADSSRRRSTTRPPPSLESLGSLEAFDLASPAAAAVDASVADEAAPPPPPPPSRVSRCSAHSRGAEEVELDREAAKDSATAPITTALDVTMLVIPTRGRALARAPTHHVHASPTAREGDLALPTRFSALGHTTALAPSNEESDSMTQRLETLRHFLAGELGDDLFLQLYRALDAACVAEIRAGKRRSSVSVTLHRTIKRALLAHDHLPLAPLVFQLLQSEHAAFFAGGRSGGRDVEA